MTALNVKVRGSEPPPEQEQAPVWQCDVCGNVMLDLHCKLRCTNCGFMRDCSDP